MTTRPSRTGRNQGRGMVLQTAFRALVILRRGRWTMAELADELGIHWRTAYRVVRDLETVGVVVERSQERAGRQHVAHYQVSAAALRKLLRL